MTKKKKITRIVSLCVVILLLAAGAIAGYQYFKYQEKVEMEKEIMVEKLRAIQYAETFGMASDNNILYCTGIRDILGSDEFRDKDILFVLEKPDVKDPGHIVIFPTNSTERYLERYNRYLRRENVDLTPYDLSYPLTIENLLYNIDQIKALMKDTPEAQKSVIFRMD